MEHGSAIEEKGKAASLAAGFRGVDTDCAGRVEWLCERFLVRTVETFLGLHELLLEHEPELSAASGFEEAAAFAFARWSDFLDVALDPTFICWVTLLKDLLEPHTTVTHAQDLDEVLAAMEVPRNRVLIDHLHRFSVFALGTAHRSASNWRPYEPVPLAFSWLPGSQVEWIDDKGYVGPWMVDHVEDGVPYGPEGRRQERPLPTAQSGSIRIAIHAHAPWFHLHHVERWARVNAFNIRCRFAADLGRAVDLVEELLSGFRRQAGTVIRTCVPLTTAGITPMASGSYSRLQGTVFIAESQQLPHIAEMLIHEFNHNKLNLLQEVVPLFDPDSSGRRHYSPWRDSLRTSEGVLHALFVHEAILRFWIGLAERTRDEAYAYIAWRRVWTLLGQLRMGIDDLCQSAAFTSTGRCLLNEIDVAVSSQAAQVPTPDSSALPFFSEMKDDPGLATLPIAEALMRHRERVVAARASDRNQ